MSNTSRKSRLITIGQGKGMVSTTSQAFIESHIRREGAIRAFSARNIEEMIVSCRPNDLSDLEVAHVLAGGIVVFNGKDATAWGMFYQYTGGYSDTEFNKKGLDVCDVCLADKDAIQAIEAELRRRAMADVIKTASSEIGITDPAVVAPRRRHLGG